MISLRGTCSKPGLGPASGHFICTEVSNPHAKRSLGKGLGLIHPLLMPAKLLSLNGGTMIIIAPLGNPPIKNNLVAATSGQIFH